MCTENEMVNFVLFKLKKTFLKAQHQPCTKGISGLDAESTVGHRSQKHCILICALIGTEDETV